MSEWVKTPPTEPGWYWYWQLGFTPRPKPQCVHVYDGNFVMFDGDAYSIRYHTYSMNGEWWTTKIEEPRP